jgi:hypothetical protein
MLFFFVSVVENKLGNKGNVVFHIFCLVWFLVHSSLQKRANRNNVVCGVSMHEQIGQAERIV